MNFLINATIANQYNVSRATVTAWVQNAKIGKNNLQLVESNGKFNILNNKSNEAELARLASQGRRYKNLTNAKTVSVDSHFYDIFSAEEIVEIISDLRFKKEINLKFRYKNRGADLWDTYYLEDYNPVNDSAFNFLKHLINDIEPFIPNNPSINLVDLGPGNAYPVKKLLGELIDLKYIQKYLAIDIAPEMNDLAQKNINKWYPNLPVYKYEKDFETQRFGKILLENRGNLASSFNLMLYIGNTITNSDDRIQVLKNIRSGMINKDLLVVTSSLDSLENRLALDHVSKDKNSLKRQAWHLEMMGIDIEKCTTRVEYNEKINAKVKYLILDKDYVIDFDFLNQKNQVELYNNDSIVIWKHFLNDLDKILF
jgi:uncharacterized SAM-dependent methyltransferase